MEAGLRRALAAHEVVRTSPGHYALAPPRPKTDAPKPAPEPKPQPAPTPDEVLKEALARDAERKREARRKDAQAALERARAADAELRDRLICAAGGNVTLGPCIDDISPIRAAMQLVDLDTILTAIQARHDPRLSWPTPEPLQTWRDPALLQKIVQLFTRLLVPRLVGEWSKAKAPPKPVERAEPKASSAERPSILRGYEAGGVPIGEDEDPGDGA